MNSTTQHDALGYSNQQEIAQILQGKATAGHHLSKGEHDKNMSIFALEEQIDQALYKLSNYTD